MKIKKYNASIWTRCSYGQRQMIAVHDLTNHLEHLCTHFLGNSGQVPVQGNKLKTIEIEN